MSDVIGVAVDNWDHEHLGGVIIWLQNNYGPSTRDTWYIDYQPLCIDLVMHKEIYFIFRANKWQQDTKEKSQ